MAEPPELSVVVPAYNESGRLPQTLSVIKPYLNSLGMSWELILVNDGSGDPTMELIRAEEALDPGHLRGIDIQPNGGKGRAVAAGVLASKGALVLISDADFSTPIDELAKLQAAIEGGSDLAIGSRAKRGSKVEISQPAHRVLMGKIFNLIVQLAVLPGFWDTQCGFKLWKGQVAREVFAEMKLDGNVAFDVEVLYRARRRGYRIAEIPVRWYDSIPSRISPLRHSAEALVDIARIRFLK
ncbi:MAG TPA: dolichyl-phosphate beta-glucosyltransferase [Candidatus Dormibacteraeota bacterium]